MPAKNRRAFVTIRLSADERAVIEEAARQQDLPLSAVCRRAMLPTIREWANRAASRQ